MIAWRSCCRTDQKLRWRSSRSQLVRSACRSTRASPLTNGIATSRDLRVAALLTRADMDTASRGAAHTLGIPVIDLSPRPDEGAGAFSLVGSVPSRAVRSGLAAGGADHAFILLTSGSTSRPKMVPLTQAGVCLSAYNAGATLALGPQDRLLNVLPLFHAHGLILGAAGCVGCRIKCGLHPRIRSRRLLRLADGVSTDLVHGGSDNPSGVVVGGRVATNTTSSSTRCVSFARPLRRCRPTWSADWNRCLASR